jgi:hypothetical protein
VSDLEDARREAELRLETSRRIAEERLAEVRSAVGNEVGRVPRNASLLLVGLAAAAGFALALRSRRRRAKGR